MNSPMAKILKFAAFFLVLFSIADINAQNNAQHEKLSKKFKNYEIASIPSIALYDQLDVNSRNQSVVIDVGDGMKWDLELELNPIFVEKYSLVFVDKTV